MTSTPDSRAVTARDGEAASQRRHRSTQNIGAALEAGGARWDDGVKLTIYLVDTPVILGWTF